jgi:hypothetical protein
VRNEIIVAFAANRDLADREPPADFHQSAIGDERPRQWLLQELILRLAVTASGTQPIEPSTATYIVALCRRRERKGA